MPAFAQDLAADEGANNAVLNLDDGLPHRNPIRYMSFYLDPTRSLDIEQISAYRAEFRPIRRKEIEFGYVEEAIWIRLPVANTGPDSLTRVLSLETNWMESMRVWLATDTGSMLILDQSQGKAFSSRKVPHRNLVTWFNLEPRQTATLWLRYSSRGSASLPVNIETELSFVERSQYRASKSIIFYALMALFIAVASLSFFLFRSAIFPIYVCYASSVLLYVVHRDGYSFQYLWPSMPGLNSFASLPLGVGLGFFAILFSRQYLTTSASYPKTDRLLIGCMALLLLLIPYGLFIDEQHAKQTASLWVFLVAVILLGLGIRSWLDRGRRMVFFVAGWLGVVGASLAMVLGSLFGAEISRETTLDAIRLAMVFDAVMMGFAIAESVLQIRRERDSALNQQLDALQSNLGLHERLNKLEARYADAVEVARSSGKVLADATHDIRQPLFALRASLKSIAVEKSSDQLASANRNLVYLEQLVDEYLEKSTNDAVDDEDPPTMSARVPARIVLTAIEDMFADEARSGDLKLRVRSSNANMRANPMVITRIVSNFVANALRYTKDGGVLVGVRKKNTIPYLMVYDTGPGMDDGTLQRVRQRAERGPTEDTDGKGLGLDIALSLARQNGLATITKSSPERGSLFAVALRTVDA